MNQFKTLKFSLSVIIFMFAQLASASSSSLIGPEITSGDCYFRNSERIGFGSWADFGVQGSAATNYGIYILNKCKADATFMAPPVLKLGEIKPAAEVESTGDEAVREI